jgi:hypothetical protein
MRELPAAVSNGKVLQSLATARGTGRDDYPASVLLAGECNARPPAAHLYRGARLRSAAVREQRAR